MKSDLKEADCIDESFDDSANETRDYLTKKR